MLFPAPIVAYQEGGLDDAAVRAFRDGFMKTQQSARGRMVLMLWKLTGFESVPDDYPQLLDKVAKTYTPPRARFRVRQEVVQGILDCRMQIVEFSLHSEICNLKSVGGSHQD